MNHGKRNIVFVGFSASELEKLEFEDIRDKRETWNITDLTHRFPRLLSFATLKEAKRHQGLILFYKMEEEFDFVKYDIQNRKQFKNYEYVFLIIPNRSKMAYSYQIFNIAHIVNGYSKIAIMNFYYLAYHPSIHLALKSIYKMYLEKKDKKLSRIRFQNVEKLKQYVKDKIYMNIPKVALELNVSIKWVERYLKDMNDIYHNVGYDVEKKQFYITK